MSFELYLIDTETTGLDPVKNEPVEISIYRLSTDEQKTWWLKPINFADISDEALRVNGYDKRDLLGATKEGSEKFILASKVLVEIENWLMEDCVTSNDRVLVGQNINFDKDMLMHLWNKCDSSGTFPFNKKYALDTMQIELMMNYALGQTDNVKGYSLHALTKKYGVVNSKAHSAEADVKATVAVFRKQLDFLRNKLTANLNA